MIPVDQTIFLLPIGFMRPRARQIQPDPLDRFFVFEEEEISATSKLMPMAPKAKPPEPEPTKKPEARRATSERDIPTPWPNGSAVFVGGKCDIGWHSRKTPEESQWLLGRIVEENKVYHVWTWKKGSYRYSGEGEDMTSALRLLD